MKTFRNTLLEAAEKKLAEERGRQERRDWLVTALDQPQYSPLAILLCLPWVTTMIHPDAYVVDYSVHVEPARPYEFRPETDEEKAALKEFTQQGHLQFLAALKACGLRPVRVSRKTDGTCVSVIPSRCTHGKYEESPVGCNGDIVHTTERFGNEYDGAHITAHISVVVSVVDAEGVSRLVRFDVDTPTFCPFLPYYELLYSTASMRERGVPYGAKCYVDHMEVNKAEGVLPYRIVRPITPYGTGNGRNPSNKRFVTLLSVRDDLLAKGE